MFGRYAALSILLCVTSGCDQSQNSDNSLDPIADDGSQGERNIEIDLQQEFLAMIESCDIVVDVRPTELWGDFDEGDDSVRRALKSASFIGSDEYSQYSLVGGHDIKGRLVVDNSVVHWTLQPGKIGVIRRDDERLFFVWGLE